MIYTENNVINLTKGDDASLTVSLKMDDGSAYEIGESEYLVFGLRQTPEDEDNPVLEIMSEPGSCEIVFEHSATQDIDVGFYSAEIQLMTADGKRVTVWPKLTGNQRISKTNWKNFCLMSEVVKR